MATKNGRLGDQNAINATAFCERYVDKHAVPMLEEICSEVADFFRKLSDAVKRRYAMKTVSVPKVLTVRGLIEVFLRFVDAVDVNCKIDENIVKGASKVKDYFANSAFMAPVATA